jgi:hypothetical protein
MSKFLPIRQLLIRQLTSV